MTEYRIAKSLGVSTSAVYCWFNGTKKPTLKNLTALARLLNKSTDATIKMLEGG